MRSTRERLATGQSVCLGTRGDAVELRLGVALSADAVLELDVCATPGGEEVTTIRFSRAGGRLELDRSRSSLHQGAVRGCHGGTLALGDDEPLELRVFVDRSIVEVYANGRFTLTGRIYPTREDSTRLRALGDRWARRRSSASRRGRSPLDRARGEAADEEPLEREEDEQRDRHADERAGGEQVPVLAELADEPGELHASRPGSRPRRGRSSATSRSFQTQRNWKIANAAIAGTDIGTISRQNVVKWLAPSTFADSITSYGSVAM